MSRIFTYYMIPLRNPKVVLKTTVLRIVYVHEDSNPNKIDFDSSSNRQL